MRSKSDKNRAPPSPFVNTLLIQEICHNFREVGEKDVEREAPVISAGGPVHLSFSFVVRESERVMEENKKSINMFLLTNVALSFYTLLLQR